MEYNYLKDLHYTYHNFRFWIALPSDQLESKAENMDEDKTNQKHYKCYAFQVGSIHKDLIKFL